MCLKVFNGLSLNCLSLLKHLGPKKAFSLGPKDLVSPKKIDCGTGDPNNLGPRNYVSQIKINLRPKEFFVQKYLKSEIFLVQIICIQKIAGPK